MNKDDLSAELREKANACNTPEELMSLVKEEGVELSDEDLDKISGGWGNDGGSSSASVTCVNCGSTNVEGKSVRAGDSYFEEYTCRNCGATWSQAY